MKRLLHFALILLVLPLYAQEGSSDSEESTKKLSISGSVDAYFRSNFTGPNEAFEVDGETWYLNPGTSFADRSGFSLGMANVILNYEGEKVGFVADLVFGPRGEDAVFLSIGSSNIVNQLYAYWNVTETVKLTLGNFNTFLGYEVISPSGNFNYSTSYMFSYGPFSHTGLKADFTLSEDTSLMLAVMNPTDATEFNPSGSYALGAQLGFYGQYLNVLVDPAFFEIDYTGGFDVSDKFYLGINAAYLSGNNDGPGFYGVALYPQLQTSDSFKLGLRAEYFVEDGAFGAIGTGLADSSVFATTLSGNYTVGDLTIIPELRLDSSSDDFFLDNDVAPASSLASFLVAAVYKF